MEWQVINLPFVAGLNQQADPRAMQPPELTICKDVQFDEIGGLQTRYPYASIGNAILGGGTIANARQLVANGDELLLFTIDTLYSWNAQLSKWVAKGTHLAVKVDEVTPFATTGDQIDCDRAELNGTVMYVWTEGTKSYVAAIDKATGSMLMAPTTINTCSRCRLVALSTMILLFFWDNVNLAAVAIDPAAPAIAGGVAVLATPNFSAAGYYDVTRVIGTDTAIVAAQRATTTSYSLIKVTAGLTVTASTKARTCDGPIAVSSTPDGVSVQVVRANGTFIEGDLVTVSTMVDVYINQLIGTADAADLYQITCAFRSVTDSGQYRCYAWWVAQQDNAPDWRTKYNWVNTANTIGTEADFARQLSPASRAFDYAGHVYLALAFAGTSGFVASGGGGVTVDIVAQLQNTYYLYRDDGFLTAKLAADRAGGFSASICHLPGVQLTSGATGFTWCGGTRRAIPLGNGGIGYEARCPLDIGVTFDSNEARRCTRLGSTLYVTGGELLQYDGMALNEVGFHEHPWFITASSGAAGNLVDGSYSYKSTSRWVNARGEVDRSTTATIGTIGLSGGPQGVTITSIPTLTATHKTSHPPAAEVWRTIKDPPEDAPFYLVTSKDPSVTSNPNRYLQNTQASPTLPDLIDALVDADAAVLEDNPENGGVLESLSPTASTIILATENRLFLAGIAGDPNKIWYSRQRGDGEVAGFNDALTMSVPPTGGAITALGFINETLIAFCETATYALPGDGFDNGGLGQNFGPARILATDVGAIGMESVALTPAGIVFKSQKGWQLLNHGWAVDYIGGQVSDYDSDTVVAVHVLQSKHQIRCLTSSRMLVFDYRTQVQQWSEWTIAGGLHATLWNGKYHYLATNTVLAEQSTYVATNYGLDVETAWIKPADLQGACRVRWFELLGEYRGSHYLRVRVARDYQTTYFDDKFWPPSPAAIGGPLQVEHTPSIQRCEAIKIRLTACDQTDGTPATTEALKLTGLALEVGIRRGTYRQLPAAQKQ